MGGKRKAKKKKSDIIFVLIFILGILIAVYPVISRYYYKIESNQTAEEFEAESKKITQNEINKKISLARSYNAGISGKMEYKDPYVNSIADGMKNYAHMLEVKEKIGVVVIPKLGVKEPIYAGTSEEVLQKGIGHMQNTSLPIGGSSTHCVIAGHRGLPQKELFANLDKLKKGDIFYIENIQGVLKYEVSDVVIIEPSQFEYLRIIPGKDMCTLLTCHPYMINSHRLLAMGKRVKYNPNTDKLNVDNNYNIIIIIIAIVVILMIIGYVWRRKRKKSKEKNR